MTNMGLRVREIKAAEVRRGDVIWAPDDGDWLKVATIKPGLDAYTLVFYRVDGSEAEFAPGRAVLKQEGGS
jgi:hypothetical protein